MSIHSDIMTDAYDVLEINTSDAIAVRVMDGQVWRPLTAIVGAIMIDDIDDVTGDTVEESKVESRDITVWRRDPFIGDYLPRVDAPVDCGDGPNWFVVRISGITSHVATLHLERRHVIARRRAGLERNDR